MMVFDEATHTYRIEGKVIPSVSEIVRRILPNQYKDVPEFVLRKAAEFGTDVHSMIEVYNDTGLYLPAEDERKNHCLDEWIKLKDGITIKASEMRVHYKDIYAGTFDALAEMDGKLALIDFKTTSKVHEEYLTLQLNLYRMALESLSEGRVERLAGIWLPKKGKGKIVECELIPDEKLLRMVENAQAD